MSQPNGPFLVTGASGQLGRLVVHQLLADRVGPIIATTRAPDKLADLADRGVEVRKADFTRPETLKSAFAGAARILIISTDDLAPGARLATHRTAIADAVEAGVSHIVYTSLTNPSAESPISFAPDHRETEAALAACGIPHTILRNNLYTDLFLMSAPQAVASGKLVSAAGDGKVGYVTRRDCARAAAAALAEATGTQTLDVTGPALVGQADVAEHLSNLAGTTIEVVPVSGEALCAGMVEHGVPEPVAALMVSIDAAIAKGTLAVTSTAVKDLTGSEATSVEQFLRANAEMISGASS